MDRGWYFRFLFTFALTIGAWLAFWPSIDTWLPAPPAVEKMFKKKISPGLDIQGGLRLMYEVEVDEAVRDRRDLRADQLMRQIGENLGVISKDQTPTREQLKSVADRVTVQTEGERRIRLGFKNKADAAKAADHEKLAAFGDMREVQRDDTSVVLEIRTDFLDQIRDTAVSQAREIISNRIDELGVKETAVSSQGSNIVVEMPGADEASFQRIRELISKTARLEFQIVDDDADFVDGLADLPAGIEKKNEAVSAGANKQGNPGYLLARGEGSRQKLTNYIESLKAAAKVPADHEFLIGEASVGDDPEAKPGAQQEAWRTYYVFGRAEVTGQAIEDAYVANDPQTNKPYVALNFTDDGGKLFRSLTGQNIKRRMAIILDDKVASAPVIQTEIGDRCQITLGGFRPYNQILNEANDLVIVLKAGALPVPIRPANEQMIGPTLGADGVQKGVIGALVGIAAVLLFMVVYYEMGGVVADIAVVLNLLLMLAAMALFEATMTLPGIVAIALNIGMAVDANVLINERIREELRAGKSPRSAVEQGFSRAFWSIFDSQLTTFIAAVILFQYGTGPIKGFAVTLMIGICTSLFTGVFCSRVVFEWLVRGLRVQRLRVG